MTDQHAQKQLAELLNRYTVGSVLHLLAEIYHQEAEQARQQSDPLEFDRLTIIEHALFVVALGIDAASPSS